MKPDEVVCEQGSCFSLYQCYLSPSLLNTLVDGETRSIWSGLMIAVTFWTLGGVGDSSKLPSRLKTLFLSVAELSICN